MKYVEVLPLTKTGAEDIVFTYETEEEIQVGSLVSIPLRNRFVRGLVTAIVKRPAFATKPVKKIQSVEPILTEVQIALAKKIAEYYFAPLGDCINVMLSFDFGKKRRIISDKRQATSNKEKPLALTPHQKKIVEEIKAAKDASRHLIFGVTGSGKTEIYLQLIAEALEKGKGAIVLVPEISLTPQTVERFQKRFGDKVAVWHSQMKETEKFHTWQALKSGEKMIVVGARSAIFAPISNLGYIIIDEEHEGSYKQDQTPRYEAGRVAEWLAELTGAKLVLGSATPKVESYQKALSCEYNLYSMSKRIVQEEMPAIKLVDMRDEFKKGNKSIFSESLHEAINEALKTKKQVLLFVNRRGASTFVMCRDCGFVSACPHCEVPLVYHPDEGQILRCHHCEYKEKIPVVCPDCNSFAIKYFGTGTQRVEIEIKKLFPKANVARMDRDTTKKRGAFEEIYQGFAQKDVDILIGTQLIAKGWDLPNVTVVGVISADTMLNLPDFRSQERTFSLLTQVAGRTGRGYHPGKVIIQTYNPENYAIQAAKKHDFEAFYAREIKEREKYSYPPFSLLVKLLVASEDKGKCEQQAEELATKLQKELPSASILGPSAPFLAKLAGKHRTQILIKIKNKTELKDTLKIIKELLKPGWTVDVSPENLL